MVHVLHGAVWKSFLNLVQSRYFSWDRKKIQLIGRIQYGDNRHLITVSCRWHNELPVLVIKRVKWPKNTEYLVQPLEPQPREAQNLLFVSISDHHPQRCNLPALPCTTSHLSKERGFNVLVSKLLGAGNGGYIELWLILAKHTFHWRTFDLKSTDDLFCFT